MDAIIQRRTHQVGCLHNPHQQHHPEPRGSGSRCPHHELGKEHLREVDSSHEVVSVEVRGGTFGEGLDQALDEAGEEVVGEISSIDSFIVVQVGIAGVAVCIGWAVGGRRETVVLAGSLQRVVR